MADINVKITDEDPQPDQALGDQTAEEPKKKPINFNIKLKVRRTLDGNIIVSDHPDIDVVVMPEKMKVIAFSRENFDDHIYQTQDRLMKYLVKKGVAMPDSVCGSNVYGSLEVKIIKPAQDIPIDNLMLMLLSKWIDSEKPSFVYQKAIDDIYTDRVTDPEEKDSTELGKVSA
ncbi:MAG: hypothetical protein ACO3EY_06275, partial [Candidatus Nanopelagicales bacterium]